MTAIDATLPYFAPTSWLTVPAAVDSEQPSSVASLAPVRPADQTKASTTAKVHRFAVPLIAKTGLSIVMTASVIAFCAAPPCIELAVVMLVTTVASIALEGYTRWRTGSKSAIEDLEAAERLSKVSSFGIAATAASGYSGIALHEAGHALAARACFRGADPIITVRPFKDGSTSFYTSGPMTALGRRLGITGSMMLITAAGVLASAVTATALIVLGTKASENYPTMGELLAGHGIAQIVNEVAYGISTFFLNSMSLSHDFYRLWIIGGIHPAVPIALLIALPTIGYLFATRVWKNDRDTENRIPIETSR